MRDSVVFMFSGQGSQYYHMGKELFRNQPVFKEWMLKLDSMVQKIIGQSVIAEIYSEKKRRIDDFNRTLYTHPAIFMIEYSLAQALIESGVKPNYVMGTSLGEFASAAVSGAMGVEDTLECVLKQAEIFETHCQNGGMLAIIYDSNLYYEELLIRETSELVAVNYKDHFVIAGDSDSLKTIQDFLEEEKIPYLLLPVMYAFHSSLIECAEVVYKEFLKDKTFKKPEIPFVSCIDGKIMSEIPQYHFWNLARRQMHFPEAIRQLEQLGSHTYIDVGPGGTLANFVKYNLPNGADSRRFSIITPFGVDLKNFEKVKALV